MKILLFVFCLTPFYLNAQVALPAGITGYLSSSGNSRNLHDAFSFLSNPASLHQLKHGKAAIYSEKRFMLKALSLVTAAFSFPGKSSGYGISLSHTGHRDFHSTVIGLASSRKLSDVLAIGVQFNYYRLGQVYYGSKGAANCSAGLQFTITENLRVSAGIKDFLSFKTSDFPVRTYEMAAGYQAGEQLFLWTNISKEQGIAASVFAGIEYAFNRHFAVKGGVGSVYAETCVSVKLKMNQYALQMTVSHYQQLGITPGLMISFSFDNQNAGE